MARWSRSAISGLLGLRSLPGSLSRLLLITALAVGIAASLARTQQAPWKGPWSYQAQLGVPAPCADDDFDEFSHAALIPHGPYSGKILLWRLDRDNSQTNCPTLGTTTAWIFDPISPAQLLKISQTVTSDIFCSGMTWDARGQLVVAGGFPTGGAPEWAFRFRPNRLGVTTLVGGYPEVQYDPLNPP